MGRVEAAEGAEGKRVDGAVEDGPALGGKLASALLKMRDMGELLGCADLCWIA